MPAYRTIANFRKDNAAALKAANRDFVLLARELGLLSRDRWRVLPRRRQQEANEVTEARAAEVPPSGATGWRRRAGSPPRTSAMVPWPTLSVPEGGGVAADAAAQATAQREARHPLCQPPRRVPGVPGPGALPGQEGHAARHQALGACGCHRSASSTNAQCRGHDAPAHRSRGPRRVPRAPRVAPQYRYSSCLNGPLGGTPMYSAWAGVSRVSFAPTLARCSAATFSSSVFGNV